MASNLIVLVTHDGSVTSGDISGALSGLDVSQSSPVDARGSTFGYIVEDDEITVRNEGHDGDWTRTSQDAVLNALRTINGVDDVEVVEGGYEPPNDDDDADAESGADESDSTDE